MRLTGLASRLSFRPAHLTAVGMLLATTPAAAQQVAKPIRLDVHESTQLAFDLSLDGRTLAFDLLGQIWTMPADGGEAHALTDAVRDTAEDLEPVFSPDGKWIAFQSDRPGGYGIWLIPSTGGTPRLLVETNSDRVWPAWSPDGTSIVFLSGNTPGLAIVTVADGAVRHISVTGPPTPSYREPIWSRDGRQILFVNAQRFTALGGTLWRVADSGGIASRAFGPELRMNAPALSPDGRIAFFVRDSLGVHQLWVADSLGGAARRITNHDDTTPLRARWTKDGRSVIYHADGQLWRVPISGGSARRIALHATLSIPHVSWRPPRLHFQIPGRPVQARGHRGLALSPDGRQIAMIALDSLWVFAPGTPPRAITGVPETAEDLAWSPDARRIAWSAGRERDLFVTDLANRTTHRLTALADDEYRPAWSPDGRFISFLHGPAGWREQRVRVVPAEAAKPIISVDSTLDVGADPFGRYLSSDNLGQEALQWSPDSRSVMLLDAATSKLVRGTLDGRRDTLANPVRNAAFMNLIADTAIVFIREDQLWSARFHRDSGIVGEPRRLSDDPAIYPSVARNGTVLYISSDGLRLRLPNGDVQRLGWPLTYRTVAAPPLLLRNVSVFDPVVGRISTSRDILLRDGRIQRVAASGSIGLQRGVRLLDAAGRIAVPGLVDLHQHLWDDVQPAGLLYNGVTTARDLGSAIARTAAVREAIDAGVRPGPRIVFSGFQIHTTAIPEYSRSGQFTQALLGEAAVTRALDIAAGFGADYLKLYQFGRWADAVQSIELAHARGLRVTGHVAHPLPFVAAGVDAKEHVGRAGGYHRLDSFVYDDVVQLFRQAHIDVIPTITVFASAARLYDDSTILKAPEAQPYLSPYLRFFAANFPSPTRNLATRRGWQRTADIMRAATRRLHTGGVRLGVGTDAPVLAWGVHWELEELVASGFTPAEALRAATSDAADILGTDDIGRITKGKLADLLLLDADPLRDIRNTRRIWRVVKAGRVYDPARPVEGSKD